MKQHERKRGMYLHLVLKFQVWLEWKDGLWLKSHYSFFAKLFYALIGSRFLVLTSYLASSINNSSRIFRGFLMHKLTEDIIKQSLPMQIVFNFSSKAFRLTEFIDCCGINYYGRYYLQSKSELWAGVPPNF